MALQAPAGSVPDTPPPGFVPDDPDHRVKGDDILANFKQSDTSPNEVDPNTIGTFVSHLWAGVNPVKLGQMLPWPKAAGGSGLDNPLLPSNIVKSLADVKQQANAALAKKDYVTALSKYVESVVPILGPIMSRIGDESQQGKGAAAAGDAAALVTGAALSRVDPATAGDTLRAAPGALVRGAAKAGGAIADTVSPDLVGVASPRLGKALQVLQKVRDAAAPDDEAPSTATIDQTPAPAAPKSPGGMSPQQTLNELAIQARRQQITLSDTDYEMGTMLVAKGVSPQQAVAAIGKLRRPTAPPVAATPTPAVPPASSTAAAPIRLTAEEVAYGQKLVAKGASQAQALKAILALRKSPFAALPSSASVDASVAARNASGRWGE